MVQPGRLHGICARVRRPSNRLARAGAQVLLRTILSTALYISTRRLHQGSELGGARSKQSHDLGQQSVKLHVPPR